MPPPGAVLESAPEQVEVWLDAPLAEGSSVQVLDERFQRVDLVATEIDPATSGLMRVGLADLPPGGYTVQWTAIDALDGHRTRGSFAFDVVEAPFPIVPASLLSVLAIGLVWTIRRRRSQRATLERLDP